LLANAAKRQLRQIERRWTRMRLTSTCQGAIRQPGESREERIYSPAEPWHFWYFLPLPQGQGSSLPTLADELLLG
jgi:hypothetical protein